MSEEPTKPNIWTKHHSCVPLVIFSIIALVAIPFVILGGILFGIIVLGWDIKEIFNITAW
jgi:hypothetical protein